MIDDNINYICSNFKYFRCSYNNFINFSIYLSIDYMNLNKIENGHYANYLGCQIHINFTINEGHFQIKNNEEDEWSIQIPLSDAKNVEKYLKLKEFS